VLKTLNGLAIVTLIWLASACGGGGELPTASRDDSFSVGAEPHLTVDSQSGDVEIVASQDGKVTIQAILRDAPNVQYEASQEGDNVLVKATVSGTSLPDVIQFRTARGADLTIAVPPGTRLEVKTLRGSMRLSGIEASGTVHTGAGPLALTDVRGEFMASTGTGDIDVTRLDGAVALETTRGEVDIVESTGAFSVKTGYGRVVFDGTLTPRGHNHFESNDGRLLVRLVDAMNLAIDAKGSSVEIKPDTSFTTTTKSSNNFVGTLGSGETYITLRATSGSIDVSLTQ
jgi:hypothetical protein